jgi:protein-L-isoaspartate(D-aspartate) O-methyltransferase
VAGEDADGRVFRRALVDTLRADGHLRSARVAAALEAVPREVFVPGLPLEDVYRPSEAIVTKRVDGVSVSSASAPEVIALMLEQLDPRPGDRVLEIGAGTGYNAALLAHLVGETGQVVTLDIDEDLVHGAREHLRAAGFSQVEVVQTDGALGSRDDRVYDRIILTVSSSDIAPAWREQLAPDHGRLVMPLGLRGPQRSVAFKSVANYLVSDSVRNCSFIPLRGLLASGTLRVPLDRHGARLLTGDDAPLPLGSEAIVAHLRAPMRSWPSGVSISLKELREGLHLWLVTHHHSCILWGGRRVPDLFGSQDGSDGHGTFCVLDAKLHGLALLAWADTGQRAGELVVQAPVGAEALAENVLRTLREWQAAGRPTDANLQIRAYPRNTCLSPADDEVVLEQRWSRFVLNWTRGYAPATLTV